MSLDDLDDWEVSDFKIPIINVLTQEQLQRIEERKLIEESDTELAKELFSDTSSHQKIIVKNEIAKTPEKNINITKQYSESKIKKINNRINNELKQKKNSEKILEAKLKKQREIELYGEPEEIYEYDEYDSLYHS
jgi:hypothetical protein